MHLDPVFAIGIVSGIVSVVAWIAGAVADIAAAVVAALAAVWAAIGPILLWLWNGLKFVWSDVLKPTWELLKSWGEKVYQLYKDHVKPIVDWIQGVAKTLRQVYKTFIQPIRDLISILEQFLRLTGLANTAIGSWLDGELHRLDGTIARMWEELTKPINLLLHLVNEVILDAKGILQAPLLLESTATYMGTITAQWWEHSIGTIKTDWKSVLDGLHTGPRIERSVSDARMIIQDGSGGLSPAMDHGKAAFDLLMADDYQGFDYLTNGVGPTGEKVKA